MPVVNVRFKYISRCVPKVFFVLSKYESIIVKVELRIKEELNFVFKLQF